MSEGGEGNTAAVAACLVGDSPVRLWGLSSGERLRRQLAAVGVERLVDDPKFLPERGSVLLLRADCLYDARTLRDLLASGSTILEAGAGDRTPVAAHVPGRCAPAVYEHLSGRAAPALDGIDVRAPESLTAAYDGKLLRSEPVVVLPIRPADRARLERHLFDGSYKGVTDLVTKWLWPLPARAVTRVLARFGVRPNMVTALSVVLVVAATILFVAGAFGSGLVAAWIMTFLDTVDGKLARVTVDSTRVGHFVDKGLDIIHPPFWYVAWAAGLSARGGAFVDPSLYGVCIVIVAGYIAGRLLEGSFDFGLGKFPIFSWRPVDSYSRLITARRNPNLLILSVALAMGRPHGGLLAVAVWTALSTAFLLVRVAAAAYQRVAIGPLHSWLEELSSGQHRGTLAARLFAANRRDSPGNV